MPLFDPGMLDELNKKLDIVDVMSPYVQFQKAQGGFKALCPFHFEHTPSFVVYRKDMHYHCFGCGAHGGAISFLTQHLKISFQEAVQTLAERFGVEIRYVEEVQKGPSILPLKQVMKELNRFYHFCLQHTPEGQRALCYLYDRGMDLSFIKLFEMGYAPNDARLFESWIQDFKIDITALTESGALKGRGLIPFFLIGSQSLSKIPTVTSWDLQLVVFKKGIPDPSTSIQKRPPYLKNLKFYLVFTSLEKRS